MKNPSDFYLDFEDNSREHTVARRATARRASDGSNPPRRSRRKSTKATSRAEYKVAGIKDRVRLIAKANEYEAEMKKEKSAHNRKSKWILEEAQRCTLPADFVVDLLRATIVCEDPYVICVAFELLCNT